MVHAGKEAIWIGNMLCELLRSKSDAVELNCDNQSAIALSKVEGFHPHTKHIDIHYHWIREKIKSKQLNIRYVSTDEQLADILTKALTPVKVKRFVDLLGLRVCGGV